MELVEYNQAKDERRRAGRRRVGEVLRMIYNNTSGTEIRECMSQLQCRKHKGVLVAWVEGTYAKERDNVERILHNIKCIAAYIRMHVQPEEQMRRAKEERAVKRRKARWQIYALLVRIYKQEKQQRELEGRAKQREGKVCAHTRNVERLAPKGGVKYDETERRGERIKKEEVYRTHRWPKRDKHGPTLVKILHHIWGIT